MKCKLFLIFVVALIICGLFQVEAGKKKMLKKGLKVALIASALKPKKAIIPIPLPLPVPVHIPIHQSWPAPSWPAW